MIEKLEGLCGSVGKTDEQKQQLRTQGNDISNR